MKISKVFPAVIFFILISDCSTSSHYIADKDNEDTYITVIDYDKVLAVERATKNSSLNIKSYWVNYPKKRIKKSEYLTSKK